MADANAALDGGHYLGRVEYSPRVILADRDGDGNVVAVAAAARLALSVSADFPMT